MTDTIKTPMIIQGGMGVGLSSVNLARVVSKEGQLGVVSGTALATTFLKRIYDSEIRDQILEALEAFPYRKQAEKIIDKYVTKRDELKASWRRIWMPSLNNKELDIITVLANFVEVRMAKKDHDGLIGINYLEKIQLPTLASIYGAVLAGVDYIIMGAGIPQKIPGIIEKLTNHSKVSLPLRVDGAEEVVNMEFDPSVIISDEAKPKVKLPKFLAIVSSAVLAKHLLKGEDKAPDGFVVETRTAGGHNAGPRGKMQLDETGQPIYGPKDDIDFEKIKALGKPFWIGGSFGTKAKLDEALAAGAEGIQVGTAFAFSKESGMNAKLRSSVLSSVLHDNVKVFTDPLASPTGFPFKLADVGIDYTARERVCDIGYLREPYVTPSGSIGYRCAAEPVADYVRKGGNIEDTEGRLCLCNGLLATIDEGEERDGYDEPAILSSGDEIMQLKRFLHDDQTEYSATDVVKDLLGK